MKRFHLDHEGVLPDESVVALWRGDEGLSSAPFVMDSSYSANFALTTAGATAGFKAAGFFGAVSAGSGARWTGEAGTGWLQSGASGASPGHLYCNSNWSVSMWSAVPSTAVTQCLLEFASTSTVTDIAGKSPLGIYRLANGNLRIQWDLDNTPASLAHFCDFPAGLTTQDVFKHLAVTKASTSTADLREVSVYVNGEVVSSTYMFRTQNLDSTGASGRWVIGASRRFGTAAGNTPAMAQSVYFDDLAFYGTAFAAPKIRELYRNGVRSWGEKNLYESGASVTKSRVLIEDGDGVMVDLSNLYDTNWVKSIDTKNDVEQQIASASISLMRFRGPTLNLSPLSETSALNLNASSTFEALLDLRRKVRVETAMVPAEWRIQGWEWEPLFEGFIDGISWETDTVKLECLDRTAPLADTFQLDPRAYDYYTSQPLAETHIQALIDNNNPSVKTGVDVLDVGYKGGTPTLYTPASSGWALNYDDTPSGDVAAMVQSVADQIGWTVRHKWYDPWQTDRLTFYAPPRLKTIDIAHIVEDDDGLTTVTTRTHHGLIEGQTVTIAGTTAYNTADIEILEITAYNKFRYLSACEPSSGFPWTSRTSAADNPWIAVTYGDGLFVAVATSGSGNRVMTSPDGITWTSRTSAANNEWQDVVHGGGLFVAVSNTGTGNRVMTSPDGITWTSRTSAADNDWSGVAYDGAGLFVAVSTSGTGNRVMTSPDGITWTIRTSAADNAWEKVVYGEGLFVAVADTGVTDRVMTSPDGITWTSRTSAADNDWLHVAYGAGLFVAVADTGVNNRVMTSPDGITWTIRTTPGVAANTWAGVVYGCDLFAAVSYGGGTTRVMTSSDGITWSLQTSAEELQWVAIAYGAGLFVAVAINGTGNRVMTSP